MDNQNINTQPENNASEAPVQQTAVSEAALPPVAEKHSTLESVFAWVLVALGYLFCHAFPPQENPLGIFAVILAIIGFSFPVLHKAGVKLGFGSVALAVTSAVLAFGVVASAADYVKLLAIFASFLAYCYFVYSASGNRLEKGMSDLIIIDFFRALIVFPYAGFFRIYGAMFRGKQKKFVTVLLFLLGLLIAIIPTFIVVALLSYDSTFVDIVDDVLNFIGNFNPLSNLGSLIFGIFIAMFVFGLYSMSVRTDKTVRIFAKDCHGVADTFKLAPAVTAVAVLLPLLAVYVIFFISQWQYYVSAFSGVLPQGLSYAEYARNGFFQLCWVAAINMFMLALVAFFMRRETKAENTVLRVLSVVFSVATLVLIATAISKMVLYIDRFGLTEKRVITTWFMVLLAIIFTVIILRQIFTKIKIISVSTIVTAVMLCVLLLSNCNGFIANYNVEKYISGELEEVDIHALFKLEEASVPALTRLAEHWEGDEENAAQLKKTVNFLELKQNSLEKKNVITGFSIPDMLAKNALDNYFGE